LAVLATALLLGISPLAADLVIQRGIDAFTTTANGKTYYDFAHNPIPAGFFCSNSKAFTGRVVLKGLPITTGAPGQLRGADTVVERLDDAVFDASGTAETRIRFRALSLVSVAPIKTACGAFHVYVSIAGKQRTTTMRIFRTHENGGNFVAPLAVNVRLTFIPVRPPRDKSSRKLEMTGSVTFSPKPIPWSLTGGPSTKRIGSVLVDTDGDLTPDTLLSGTSNFSPGWSPAGITMPKGCTMCEPEICHWDSGEEHCTGPTYACYPYNCP
jgi:hypothetical protein